MNRLARAALALGMLLAVVPAALAAEDDAAKIRELTEQKARSIVTVKFLLKIHLQAGVREDDRELEREVPGVLVTADGLVLVSNTHLRIDDRSMRNVTVTSNPVNFKIVFPEDEEQTEHDAVLGATDSNLNLAFIQMKGVAEKEGLELHPVDFEKAVKPDVAQELVGVSRLARGFDFVPYFGLTRIAAKIAKPRRMSMISGNFSVPGAILFDHAGAPTGVLALQEGAAGQARGLFLIPGDVIRATIKQASESAKQVLAEDKGSEEESGDGEDGEDEGGEDEGDGDEGE